AGFLLTGLAAVLLIRKRPPEQRAAGMLGLFAITAQFVQAVTDFGLSMPANALTFAVLCGSVCGTACAAADFDRIQSPLWLGLARLDGRWSLTLLSLVMSLASLAFGVDLFTSTRAAAARNAVIALDVTKPLETRPEALTGAIERAERALRLRPDDPELHRAVALWWIDRYRLTAASELSRAADPAERLSGRRLWQATSLQVLAARALDLRRQGDLGRFDSLRQLPMIRDNLVPARQHLLAAARYGPLSRDVSRYFAELWFLSGEDEELSSAVGTHLKRAVFIAPSSPDQLFAAAMLAERAGLLPLADRAYFRCLTVSDEHILPVWSFISKSRPVEALLQSTIPHRPEVLVTLAEQASDEVVKNTLAEEAERLLNDGEWEDRDSPSNLLQARLAELQGKTDVAIRHYRLALGAATLDIEMRLRLAQLLVAAGHDQEAEAEFSVLHGLAPHRKDLKDQLDALKTRRINEVPNHGQ
ncbi:MAG: tetratricopeptide repeat protein, partial [Planctomycetaceae bacterium]